MNSLLPSAWVAEAMKLRGTLALALAVFAPVLVVALFCAQMLLAPSPSVPPAGGEQAWLALIRGMLALWCFLMLPLYVTLQAALLANMEHANQQWKHLLALPVPRHQHFLAKGWALGLLSCLSAATLYVGVLLAGYVLAWIKPSLGIGGPPPWQALLGSIVAATAASALMAVLQMFIALRARSFTVAVGTGMAACVAGFLIGQSDRFGPLYPWTMPLHTVVQGGAQQWPLAAIGLSAAVLSGGALAYWLGRYPPE